MPEMGGMGWSGKEVREEGICVYTELIHFVAQQKLTILESNCTPIFKKIGYVVEV